MDQLRRHLDALVGERSAATPDSLQRAQDYVAATLARTGYQVRLDPFVWMGERYHNVVATRPGGSARRLILGAHFDTVEGTPGADDNASGVAVLLEAARLLARQPLRCTLECVAFNLEEMNMAGSTHYAQALQRSRAKDQRLQDIVLKLLHQKQNQNPSHEKKKTIFQNLENLLHRQEACVL